MTKLAAAQMLLVVLAVGFFLVSDQAMRAMIVVLLFVLVIPISILCCVDASRAIAGESHANRFTKIFGAVLGVLQVILGIALAAIGFVYPFIGIGKIYEDISQGRPTLQDLLWILISLTMLALGCFYLKESLWLVLGRRGLKRQPINESTRRL